MNLNETSRLSTGGKVLIGLTGGVGLGLSIICLPFVAPAFRKICLPYVPATSAQVQNVMNALKSSSGKLVDIGSGDGRIVIAAAKNGFVAHGVELNPWLVQYSRINALINNMGSKTSFYKRDLWKFDLGSYNNIVIFGVEEMMGKLEVKINSEAKDGTVIVACRFPFENMTAERTVGEGIDTVWYYKLKKSY